MPPPAPDHPHESEAHFPATPGVFQTTEWSVVLEAGSEGERKRRALEKLCRTYWRPVYFFVRRMGHEAEAARDLTQAFFAHLLEKDFFATADPERGRFRGYLRQSCRMFLGNEWQKSMAHKRGGGQSAIPWDTLSEQDERALSAESDPSREFDRQWTHSLLHNAMSRLEAEHATAEDKLVFSRLRPFLTNRPAPGDYARLAVELKVAPGTVPVLVHRLGKRYQELIRAEVGATLLSRGDVDDELRHCLQALG